MPELEQERLQAVHQRGFEVAFGDRLGQVQSSAAKLDGWYDDWVVLERERIRQLQLHALDRMAAALLAAEEPGRALDVALVAVQADPLREGAHRIVVRIHLWEGNALEALRAYERFAQLLEQEVGVAPSTDMRRLVAPSSDRRDAPRTPGPVPTKGRVRRLPLALLRTNFNRLAAEVAEEFRAAVSLRGLAPDPAVVPANHATLHRALGNLTDNAVRLAPSGSPVTVGVGVSGAWRRLSVGDEGPGIPADQPSRVFGRARDHRPGGGAGASRGTP